VDIGPVDRPTWVAYYCGSENVVMFNKELYDFLGAPLKAYTLLHELVHRLIWGVVGPKCVILHNRLTQGWDASTFDKVVTMWLVLHTSPLRYVVKR
jgi:hypothetical protein